MITNYIKQVGLFSGQMSRLCGFFFVVMLLQSCNDHTPQYYEDVKNLSKELEKRDVKILELADSICNMSERIADEETKMAIQEMAGDIGSVFENDEGFIYSELDELLIRMSNDVN